MPMKTPLGANRGRRRGGKTPTLTQRANSAGVLPAEARATSRAIAAYFPGGLSKAESRFAQGAGGQDLGKIREVITRARKANKKNKKKY